MWSVATVSLHLAVLNRFRGRKRLFWGRKWAVFSKGTPRLGGCAPGRHQSVGRSKFGFGKAMCQCGRGLE